MYCEECGKKIPDGSLFCDGCGAPVHSEKPPVNTEDIYGRGPYPERPPYIDPYNPLFPGQEDAPVPPGPEPAPKKNTGTIVLIVVLSVVAAALIVALICLGIKTFGNKGGESGRPGTGTAITEATDETDSTQEETVAEESGEDKLSIAPSTTAQASLPATVPAATTQAATTAASDDYILPESNTRYLTEADISGLTKEQLRLARNEIYARHGRKFKDETLNTYFMSKSWYTPLYEPDQFNESVFNDYEIANRKLIADYEKKMGY